MSESRDDSAAQLGYEDGWIERIGIPRPLFWGFVGVLIFMIGDGIEISFVSKYLASPEGGNLAGAQASFATVTVYGAAVAIASYFSGTLSSIWGPRRVMWLGAAWWVVFELLFLFVAIPSQSPALIIGTYGLRGFAYPLFAFGFLVWIQTTTREDMRGSAAGWFWFAFTGGLPTLGSAVAAVSLGIVGDFNTLVLSLVVVAIGGAIGCFAVREAHGTRPIVDEDDPDAVEDPTSYRRLLEGVDILWRDPRTALGVLNFGVGAAAFVGPALVTLLNPFVGPAGVVVTYSALYVVCAFLTTYIKDESDPAEKRALEASSTATA